LTAIVLPGEDQALALEPQPGRLLGGATLVADALTVTFPGRDAPALQDVGVRLKAGARVAVVGTSGAGKTTLARALVRFLDPASGSVTVGGRDVRACAQADVRHAVRLAGQDAHLFTTTIRQNVALARPGASDEDIAGAQIGLDAATLAEIAVLQERYPNPAP